MEINTDQVVQDCFNAIREKVQNLTTLNIIVAGKTGVGKSTLINSVFRENLAETGMGRPAASPRKTSLWWCTTQGASSWASPSRKTSKKR